MEPAGLTSLPVEVIHHISCYLSVQDVLSCSLTCHYLRNALNDNFVWRKYLPCDLSGLEIQEQRLTPALNINESLSHLCENRQHFVRKTQVMNNWRQGHCVHYKGRSKFSNRMINQTRGMGNVMYNNKYIFFFCSINDDECPKRDVIDVWDITETPFCHTVWEIEDLLYPYFFVVGSYLVVVVDYIKVFVYRINLPETDLPLMFSFLITEENVTFRERVEHSGIPYYKYGWNHATVKNYLISSQNGDSKLIHIWDIHSASKVGCFEPSIECFRISLHSFIGKHIFFHIFIEIWDVYPSVKYALCIFDIEKFQFTKHSFNISDNTRRPYISIFEDYVIIFDKAVDANPDWLYDTVCSIFDLKTSLKLKKRRFDNASKYCEFDSVAIVNGRFVVLCNDGFHIVDALTLETVGMFKEDNVSCITKQMVLFQSYVVVACHSNNQLELWDVNRKIKLPVNLNLRYSAHLYWDKFGTKLVIRNADYVNVVHFW